VAGGSPGGLALPEERLALPSRFHRYAVRDTGRLGVAVLFT
jgi:hypothetical protein